MPAPVRYSNGVTNVGPNNPFAELGMLDPTKHIVFHNDFFSYAAADWVITTVEAGAGSATEALASGNGGLLLVTNDSADDDSDFFQWAGNAGAAIETFKFISGKKTWFKARFKVSDATQSDFVMGLQITDTTPLAVTDGVYFRKDDGDADLDFVVIKDSTATTASAFATAADDTFMTLAFYYNGVDAIKFYKDDVQLGTSVTTNLCDDEELAVSFGIQNGAAAAKSMTVDYITCITER